MPPRAAKPATMVAIPTPSPKVAKVATKAVTKTTEIEPAIKTAKATKVAVTSANKIPVPTSVPTPTPAPTPAPVPITPVGAGGAETPRRKSRASDDEKEQTSAELVKTFAKAIRKRIASGDVGDVDVKDVKSIVRLLNQLRKDVAPKPKGDRAPMNAFFYYQALRHLQVKKNGGPTAKEAARIKELTEAQPEDKPLAAYMILSKLFNEDEYKGFSKDKRETLDATAKGFSLFRLEKFPGELEDKNKPLADWVALKEAERVTYEKRAKTLAADKHAAAAAEKEATKKAKDEIKKAKAEKKAAKTAAKEADRAAKAAVKAAAATISVA